MAYNPATPSPPRLSPATTAPCPILDSSELELLRRFCADPSAKEVVLRDSDMLDEPGDWPGKKAQSAHGSLAGFAIARHGTETPALEEREIEMLRKWFESGVADARINGSDGRTDMRVWDLDLHKE